MGSKPIMCIAHYLHSVTLYKELLYLSINTIIFNVQCIVYSLNKQLCICAAEEGHDKTTQILLDRGSDPSAVDIVSIH